MRACHPALLAVSACLLLSACKPAVPAAAPVPAIAPARAPASPDVAAAPARVDRTDPLDSALAARVAARLGQALGAQAIGTLQVQVRAGVVQIVPLPGAVATAADVQTALRGVPGLRALDTRALP